MEHKEIETLIPVSSDHYMEEMRNFLIRLEGETVRQELPRHGGEVNIRSKADKASLLERLTFSTEDLNSALMNTQN